MVRSTRQKTIIITGASDGIGLAAARKLKKQGAHVVLVGRSPEKTRAAASELSAPYHIADFAKLSDVRRLAKELIANHSHIDVLINNAGGIFGARQLTEDGYEKTMQVNHLAHFLLTNLLMDTLIASSATIINTSSVAHQVFAEFDITDLNMQKKYSPNRAYGNAKLENILFTKELDRRFGSKGVAAAAFHPGNVATSFARDSRSFLRIVFQSPLKYFMRLRTPEEGADTLVWLATTDPGKAWRPGLYYYKRKIAKTSPLVSDAQIAKSLWEQSAQMTRV